MRVILGSASPARLKTLQNAGVFPEVIVSDVDERAAVAVAEAQRGSLTPAEHALLLATAKAEAVAFSLCETDGSRSQTDRIETPGRLPSSSTDGLAPSTNVPFPSTNVPFPSFCASEAQKQNLGPTIVIGCDSVFEFEGKPYGRPPSAEVAFERIKAMSGKSGILHTGHFIFELNSGRGLGTVGSSIVHFGQMDDDEIAAYVATGEPLNVAGSFTVDSLGGPYIESIEGDYHNVVGISLPLLRNLLRELGIPWHTLRA